MKCPNCDISLIYHKSSNSYSCHYCGYRCQKSDICPSCHEEAIKDLGLGTEKLEGMIAKKYGVEVLRMDADTTSTKNAHQKLINEFSSGKYSILVGTQMISKGLNFAVSAARISQKLDPVDKRKRGQVIELLDDFETEFNLTRWRLPSCNSYRQGPKLTEEEKEKFRELRAMGYSIAYIASQTGRSENAVRKWVK